MDFKIGDDFDENGNVNEHKANKKVVITIVIVISIVFGLLVFFISNAILGGKDKDKDPKVDTQVSLTDENVQILYKYVAYKDGGQGNDLFLKETMVDSSKFTDQDKMYYALRFVEPEDLLYSGKKTKEKQKIYTLSITKIRANLLRFFGNEVSFTPVDKITYKFSFTINNLGVATLTYSDAEQIYNVVFDKEKEETEELVKPYYTELTSATKKHEGTLILNEKVIYTTSGKENTNYRINIYKDYGHTTLIETKQNITADDLKANPISIDNYVDRAATISYTFKVNSINNNYYFDSSSITY